MKIVCLLPAICIIGSLSASALIAQSTPPRPGEKKWLEFQGQSGPGLDKHIVLIAGDDEYRSEEALPMLGKILSQHHGFRCTVLFPIDPADGTIKPDHQTNIPGMEKIDSADLVIMGLRFRNLPDEDMQHFVDFVDAGKPMIGLRTSTHAFQIPKDQKFARYSYNSSQWPGGFGQQVLGDTWINHHGRHKQQSTRGVINEKQKDNVILRGVNDVWGPTDVYGIRNLPSTAAVLLYGSVLEGMKPTDKPVAGAQNDPMMPLVWTKDFDSESGKKSRIFCTTMGSSTDFQCEDLRRLIVNASFWCLNMADKIPDRANVDLVDPYQPTPYGFGNYQKKLKPADYDLK